MNEPTQPTQKINVTNVYERNLAAYLAKNDDGSHKYRTIVNQGGSGSSKTYSILQMIIYLCMQSKITATIVRKSLPLVRKAIEEPWVLMMEKYGIYKEKNHKQTLHFYTFDNGSKLEFVGVDDEQKIRGMNRDILYINECNELSPRDYYQLSIRTDGIVIIDYNPTDSDGWYYNLATDPNNKFILSTYKDNIYASSGRIMELENLKNTDPDYYNSLALGNRAQVTTRVYSHFKKFDNLPDDINDTAYGLDWGFSHPSAVVKVCWSNQKIYVEELLYESGLTTKDLITKMQLLIDKSFPIYVDSAMPALIKELNDLGFNAYSSNKFVVEGINKIKSSDIYVNINSENIWKEFRLYSWRSRGNVISDKEVVKYNDDCLDAMRYCINTHQNNFNPDSMNWYFG